MRKKALKQEYLDFSGKSNLKVVREYRAKYEAIGQILEANPKILDIAHGDFSKALSKSKYGRGGYTSEQMLRSIIVMFMEQSDYRETVITVESSEFLRSFIKLGNKEMMEYTFLCKAFTALSEETWKAINEVLSGYAKKKEKITGEKLRLDTTDKNGKFQRTRKTHFIPRRAGSLRRLVHCKGGTVEKDEIRFRR